jgi:hypothetical protein
MVRTVEKGKKHVKELQVEGIFYPVNSTFLHNANPLLGRLQRCDVATKEYSSLMYSRRKQIEAIAKEIKAVSAFRSRWSPLF